MGTILRRMGQGQQSQTAGGTRPKRPARRLAWALCSAWLALFFSTGLAAAETVERWRLYPEVGLLDNVALRIHWFDSSKELREAAEKSGQEINEIGLNGFSILKRNTKTGQYSCDIYVVRMTGAQIDGDRTTTFGHEVLHCFGLKHE